METYQIANKHLNATIKKTGAELCSLKYKNEELIWQANPKIWGRHAPHLFPIVGRLTQDTLHHQAQSYHLTQHGFARDMAFTCLTHESSTASFLLTHQATTLEKYPFEFELLINYTLHNHQLIIDYAVRNPANTILPFSIGGHPAFRWPLDTNQLKTAYHLYFDQIETAPIRRLTAGLLADSIPTPITEQTLHLNDSLFQHDALIFDNLNSHRVTYTAATGSRLQVTFDDFPHLGIWSQPNAAFICIEPWQGYASPVDFDGDFMDKPGIVKLSAHTEKTWQYTIEYQPSD